MHAFYVFQKPFPVLMPLVFHTPPHCTTGLEVECETGIGRSFIPDSGPNLTSNAAVEGHRNDSDGLVNQSYTMRMPTLPS